MMHSQFNDIKVSGNVVLTSLEINPESAMSKTQKNAFNSETSPRPSKTDWSQVLQHYEQGKAVNRDLSTPFYRTKLFINMFTKNSVIENRAVTQRQIRQIIWSISLLLHSEAHINMPTPPHDPVWRCHFARFHVKCMAAWQIFLSALHVCV